MIKAYMRISTSKETQRHDRQKKAITDYAKENNFTIKKWYADTISGKIKADNRPNYKNMKDNLEDGDILIISDLDRLGRNANDTIIELKKLQSKGIRIVALDVPYMNKWDMMNDDSLSRMIIDIVVTLKAHIAEQELEKTRTRINQGLSAALERGVKLGRPQVTLSTEFKKEYKKFKDGEYGKMTATAFAKMLGIGRATLYKYIDLYEVNCDK